MFTKMMICTDLTPASYALIGCVGELKEIGTREVVLTHVVHTATRASEKLPASDVEPILERQKNALSQQRIEVTLEIPLGAPAQMLDEAAEKHDVSAILIGAHGRAYPVGDTGERVC